MSRPATKALAITNRGLLVGIPLLVSLLFSGVYMAYLGPQNSRTNAHTKDTSTPDKNAHKLNITTQKASPLKVEPQHTSTGVQGAHDSSKLQNPSAVQPNGNSPKTNGADNSLKAKLLSAMQKMTQSNK